MAAHASSGVRPCVLCLAPYELSPAAESALVHRLLADGDDPNEWDVFAVWSGGDVYAVVLRRGVDVRAFTVVPEGEGYGVVEVGQR